MADTQPYNQPETQADARWMTFAELAAVRGISKLSAVALVRRHGWRRQRDNQGHMTALVPTAWADTEPTNQPEDQPYAIAFETALAAIEAAHVRELASLQERVAAAEAARIAMQGMVEQFAGQMRDADEAFKLERARSVAEIADLQRDLDAARTIAQAAQHDAQEAAQAAEVMRQADAAQKARGRGARLRAAWRGEGKKAKDETEDEIRHRAQVLNTIAAGLFLAGFAGPLISWTMTHTLPPYWLAVLIVGWGSAAGAFRMGMEELRRLRTTKRE